MEKSLFEIQPASCRAPLPQKQIEHSDWIAKEHPNLLPVWERVLFFDPVEVYNRIHHLIDPYKRVHAIGIADLFPKIEGQCACGCGKEIKPHRRFASDGCSTLGWAVRNIICNAHQIPKRYIMRYYGSKCAGCIERPGEELDHIIGVKHGGGGCWLSNYKWLCYQCHRNKTNIDFGFKSLSKNQLRLNMQ